ALELVADALDETLGPEEVKRCRPAQQQPEQAVKSRKMVHVGVRDEPMADPEDLAGRERMNVPEIEQKRPATEAEVDEAPGIGENVIDQPRLDEQTHRNFLLGPRMDSDCGPPRPLHGLRLHRSKSRLNAIFPLFLHGTGLSMQFRKERSCPARSQRRAP